MIIPEMVKTCKPTQDQHISYMSWKQIITISPMLVSSDCLKIASKFWYKFYRCLFCSILIETLQNEDLILTWPIAQIGIHTESWPNQLHSKQQSHNWWLENGLWISWYIFSYKTMMIFPTTLEFLLFDWGGIFHSKRCKTHKAGFLQRGPSHWNRPKSGFTNLNDPTVSTSPMDVCWN